jgi:hypothetical protein
LSVAPAPEGNAPAITDRSRIEDLLEQLERMLSICTAIVATLGAEPPIEAGERPAGHHSNSNR